MQFKNLRKPIATILMLSMTSLTFSPLTQPASAQAPGTYGGLAAGIAGVAIAVTSLVKQLQAEDNEKRAAFTQRTISELNQKYPDYNFVITHHKGSKAEGPGVVHRHVELPMAVGTAGYEIFGSPKGQPFKFELNGDGGYINWAFVRIQVIEKGTRQGNALI